MGSSQTDKLDSHERIVAIAAASIRENGTAGPSVAETMKAAGLTHGGFYKHFSSRDDLVAEALGRAFDEGLAAISSITEGAEDPLEAFVDWYVSETHRDNPATGCAVVALGADVSRGEGRLRASYGRQVEFYLASLEGLLGGGIDAGRRARVALSTMVGALILARAIDDETLSSGILGAARESVIAMGD
jgi:TetR/AcrR family transcriptional regulator, transcriptional repressor for nem operon